MDALEKLKLLSSQMHLEPAEDADCALRLEDPLVTSKKVYIGHATLPGGKRIPMLKTLQTSVCERNCYYCPFRSGRDFRRATFRPEEMAHTFMALYRAKMVEGIFLSSGIANGGLFTQDQMLKTAEVLRYKLGYRDYLHLKIMPGAEKAQVEQAMRLADRVSINLEAPNTSRLQALAPLKQFTTELLEPLRWVEQIRRSQPEYKGWNGRWPSTVTQFVVGAAGESDLELLATTEQLYRRYRLKRAYYSAFHPIEDTPLENQPPESPVREHRLYQASFLLRDYGFNLEDMPFDASGNLPRNIDPKLAWARSNLSAMPTDINLASREELLRIPGIGPRTAQAIVSARGEKRLNLHDLDALRKSGVNLRRATPFILVDGKRPPVQLPLW